MRYNVSCSSSDKSELLLKIDKNRKVWPEMY